MAGKDPAFLFYSLNWLQGTAGLKPEEKGVYIDLLSHQHQNGYIPNDPGRLCRMVGLSEKEFLPIWSTVRFKFVDRPDNRLVNLKLEEVMTERSTKRSTTDHTKAILSRFGVLARGIKKSAPEALEQIKKEFKVTDYESFGILEATERLNKWFTEQLTIRLTVRLPTRVENENTNQEGLENQERGVGKGEGGKEGETFWPPPPEGPPWPEHASGLPEAMVEIFMQTFPKYPRQEAPDFSACMQLAYQLSCLYGWTWDAVNNGRMPDILAKWKEIVAWIPNDKWFRAKPLSFLNDNFQGLIQAKNNFTEHGNEPRASGAKGYPSRSSPSSRDPRAIETQPVGDF